MSTDCAAKDQRVEFVLSVDVGSDQSSAQSSFLPPEAKLGQTQSELAKLRCDNISNPLGMLFHLSALSFVIVGVFLVIYFRSRIIPFIAPYLPTSLGARLSNYTPLASFSFADQASAGLTSSAFDLEESNIGSSSGESRVGLDATGVEEVRRIMAIERCNFDQARLIRHNRILAKNGIAPDGTPMDSKAITRLS